MLEQDPRAPPPRSATQLSSPALTAAGNAFLAAQRRAEGRGPRDLSLAEHSTHPKNFNSVRLLRAVRAANGEKNAAPEHPSAPSVGVAGTAAVPELWLRPEADMLVSEGYSGGALAARWKRKAAASSGRRSKSRPRKRRRRKTTKKVTRKAGP